MISTIKTYFITTCCSLSDSLIHRDSLCLFQSLSYLRPSFQADVVRLIFHGFGSSLGKQLVRGGLCWNRCWNLDVWEKFINSRSKTAKLVTRLTRLAQKWFFVWHQLPESQSCRAPRVVKSVMSPPEDLWMLGKVDSSNIMKSLLQIQERNLAWHQSRMRIPTAPWLPDPRLDQQQKSCADMASLKCGEPSLWTRWAVDLNHRRWVVSCRWSISISYVLTGPPAPGNPGNRPVNATPVLRFGLCQSMDLPIHLANREPPPKSCMVATTRKIGLRAGRILDIALLRTSFMGWYEIQRGTGAVKFQHSKSAKMFGWCVSWSK